MDETEARERITRAVAAAKEPVLEAGELDDLVALAKRPDGVGLTPADTGWAPTWDINAAAHVGWLWKAAKASGDFTFSDDAGSYNRREVFDMCERMADVYRKKVLGWLPISRSQLPWEWGSVVGNGPA